MKTKHPSVARLMSRAPNSKAQTIRGLMRVATPILSKHLPPCYPIRKARTRSMCDISVQDILRHTKISSRQVKLALSHARRMANMPGSACPIIPSISHTRAPKTLGSGYSFRWLGKWKSAPGSYQPSTRRIVVGIGWLMQCAAGIRQLPDRTIVYDHGMQLIHGWVVRHGSTPQDACLHITAPDGWTWHAPAYWPVRPAVLAAIDARKMQHRVEAYKRSEHVMHNRIYVSIEDSLAAGNCESMTMDFARLVWKKIGAQGPCAVRADILLDMRDDQYTRRAVAHAGSAHQPQTIPVSQ